MLMSISGSLGSVLLVQGSSGELTCFTRASAGMGSEPTAFSTWASWMLAQALRGVGSLFSGSQCGAEREK